ncbi:hypothetical protein KI387_023520, partial [Taxus chinensis]
MVKIGVYVVGVVGGVGEEVDEESDVEVGIGKRGGMMDVREVGPGVVDIGMIDVDTMGSRVDDDAIDE